MRRRVVLPALLLAAPLLVAGCGSDSVAMPKVSGAFDKTPTVQIPKKKPGKDLQVKTVIQGKGKTVKKNDLAVVNFSEHVWSGKSNRLMGSSYKARAPQALPVGNLPLKGINLGVAGQKVGSRVEIVVPPKYGYGKQGPQAGIKRNDTLVFVFDLLTDYGAKDGPHGKRVTPSGDNLPKVTDHGPGKEPGIDIPHGSPSKQLQAKTLVAGDGPKVKKGQLLVAHYVGKIWRTRKTFDSSWKKGKGRVPGQPAAFQFGQVVKGWDKGLAGKRVGSRVLLTIPPKEGYGSKGQPRAGIKGSDTLVFVVDILGVQGGHGH